MIDLHTHSTVSDGSEPPERIVELAHEVGCSAVALTDHDSLAGLAAARARADELGIRLVPGCEVSCVPVAGGGVHVLVYFVDDPASPLGQELDRLRDDRRARNLALAERLHELGIPVTFDHGGRPRRHRGGGRAGPTSPRPWSTSARWARSTRPSTATWPTAAPAYVPKGRLTVADVCRLARDSGGVAVLAHPLRPSASRATTWPAPWPGMAEAGLGGLEAVYGRYSPRPAHRPRQPGPPVRPGAHRGLRLPRGHQAGPAVGTGTGDLKVPDRVLDQLEAARPAA